MSHPGLRIDRRTLLKASCGLALATAARAAAAAPAHPDRIGLARGLAFERVVAWGDPLFADTPALDTRVAGPGLLALDPAVAARQFGYNCDGLQFFALDDAGERGLLCVNHEYPNLELFLPGIQGQFSGLPAEQRRDYILAHPRAVALTQALLGVSVLLIERDRRGRWRHRPGSRWARRVTATTPIEIAGPARGHALLRTRADPQGSRVLGTFGNCASGKTPWGSYLSAEENVDEYFGNPAGLAKADPRLREAFRRNPPREHGNYGWEHVDPRFDLSVEPAELLRFGWIVEVDPADAASAVRKRTALGRFKHECAACAATRDGRLAVYMGDDDRFEYVYKYVSSARIQAGGKAANDSLLDEGTLFVARFDADGSGEWLPLVQGQGPLVADNGFADQGEVLVKARAAADLLGATPMDRPEDVAVDGPGGRAYVSLTKNPHRRPVPTRGRWNNRELDLGPNAANPRGPNPYGHVIEILEAGGDCGARRFRWQILLKGGEAGAGDALGAPDNLALDGRGRLWVATDGDQPEGGADGCYVVPLAGPARGQARRVMTAPAGAEVAGCKFDASGHHLFLSIQHPGEGGTLESPLSAWPDGQGHLARPAVIALRRRDGQPL